MVGNVSPNRLRLSHQDQQLNKNFRRNGKLQSCEPCRRGKLRCDHMTPTCGRCARRNKHAQCVYHPAPLTKLGNLPTPQTTDTESISPSVVQSSEYDHASDFTSVAVRAQNNAIPQPRAYRASSLPAHSWASIHYGQQTVEELRRPVPQAHVHALLTQQSGGFTHHTAILNEHEISIGIIPTNVDSGPTSQVSPAYIERGAAVLTLFKELPTYIRYIEKWFSLARGIIMSEPMVKIFTSGIITRWGKWLAELSANDLRLMSEKVWENTLKPLPRLLKRNTSSREFCASVTGEYLRWEVVGIIVTMVALLSGSLSDGDPIFCSHDDVPVNRAALLLKTHNASEICVSFCDDFGVLNDLYLWLLYENTIVYCALRIKGSFENWKKSGILATALVFCNLHEEIKVDDNTPFFIAEMRKRLFVCAYENDKHSAIYNGRPPRLTRHYCRLQFPLDLSDSQLMLEGHDLENAIANLDTSGWNQRGHIQRCTFARIYVTEALITEEILEISMGFLSREEIERRAADIEQRAIEFWQYLPGFLKMDNEDILLRRRAPIELLLMAYIRLDNMSHHFLLQRALVKKVDADSTKLLNRSMEMFKFTLLLITHRDIFREFQIDFVQILTMHGVPTAAVIAVELLHQERNPCTTSPSINRLPRSKTIQDLSVLVACLGTIQPRNCGYMTCDRGKKFLTKILDTILDPAPSTTITSDFVAETLGDPALTDPMIQVGNDGEFMRWLESMEWEQDAWNNFS